MASPRSLPAKSFAPAGPRYRRSAFNGAKQLNAAQAGSRRIIILLGLLALALVAAIAVIVGVHLQGDEEQPGGYPAATAIHPASH
ncbi:MAG: hypothetical protein EOO36_09255 [Cytophagaceae bacterium]|nr:MAG: hypothetical protein EOO36_09255 [Cytophagaceae bacterium]